ncbi:hypothetical protein BCR32DRAFT_285468 [Anaeromyces robustus]|uniref:Uncharacterized protein n=1 Tax=Anaeromyces robustus TaxID=1754192 RepID=A0A1Y1WNK8_9FUNG|nr:hypothetical protein BCR32DRAFT_285468 [Anaeromyces robustus]|eukprot:ORX75141.1 hypothetical protein BCR32DRAFT_285468 [Anaeromyces robustus]
MLKIFLNEYLRHNKLYFLLKTSDKISLFEVALFRRNIKKILKYVNLKSIELLPTVNNFRIAELLIDYSIKRNTKLELNNKKQFKDIPRFS